MKLQNIKRFASRTLILFGLGATIAIQLTNSAQACARKPFPGCVVLTSCGNHCQRITNNCSWSIKYHLDLRGAGDKKGWVPAYHHVNISDSRLRAASWCG